jgi:dolichol-phosphate mannosyltransferase
MKILSVVVPVYFNCASLPPLFIELQDVERQLRQRDIAMELIFVDDGSQDESFAELMNIRQQRPSTVVIRLSRNFGAVHASKTGLQHASGDCATWIAADLQDPPELIVQMADHWLAGKKFVVCARRTREDSFSSKIFSWVYYRLVRLLVIPKYPEGGYDLALLDKTLLPHVVNSSKNINTPLFAYWLGFKPDIILYDRRKRIHGRSRWTFGKRIKFFIDSLLGFSVVPIRMISAVGLTVASASIIYGMSVAIHAVLGSREVPGFPTLAALVAFLLGLIIVMLGIIGEYIWRIFDEVNKRPEAVIDEIYRP